MCRSLGDPLTVSYTDTPVIWPSDSHHTMHWPSIPTISLPFPGKLISKITNTKKTLTRDIAFFLWSVCGEYSGVSRKPWMPNWQKIYNISLSFGSQVEKSKKNSDAPASLISRLQGFQQGNLQGIQVFSFSFGLSGIAEGEYSGTASNHKSLVDTSINAFWRQHFRLQPEGRCFWFIIENLPKLFHNINHQDASI